VAALRPAHIDDRQCGTEIHTVYAALAGRLWKEISACTRRASSTVPAASHAAPDARPSRHSPVGEGGRVRGRDGQGINHLKQWRGPAMRTDKLAIAYQAALHLAAFKLLRKRVLLAS